MVRSRLNITQSMIHSCRMDLRVMWMVRMKSVCVFIWNALWCVWKNIIWHKWIAGVVGLITLPQWVSLAQ